MICGCCAKLTGYLKGILSHNDVLCFNEFCIFTTTQRKQKQVSNSILNGIDVHLKMNNENQMQNQLAFKLIF